MEKYPALRTIAGFYRIIGWVIGVMTIAFVIIGLVDVFVNQTFFGGGFWGFLGAVLGTVLGSVLVLFFYTAIGIFLAMLPVAVAEGIEVFLDIEENTRS
jgi:amino acid transporter